MSAPPPQKKKKKTGTKAGASPCAQPKCAVPKIGLVCSLNSDCLPADGNVILPVRARMGLEATVFPRSLASIGITFGPPMLPLPFYSLPQRRPLRPREGRENNLLGRGDDDGSCRRHHSLGPQTRLLLRQDCYSQS